MNQKGFTLAEALMVIAMVAICTGVLVDLFIGHNRLYKSATAELNVTSDGRVAVDDIGSFVRQATRTLDSYSSYTAGPEVLILQIQSINASDQLIAGTFDHVIFYLDGNNLMRETVPNAVSSRGALVKKIASNINSLVFTYSDPDYDQVKNVTVDITLQEDAGNQTRSNTVSSKSRLRNF